MPRSKRQEVTGYVVNRKVNISKEYYRKLRMIIHLCKVRGIRAVAGDMPLEKFRRSMMGRIQHIAEVNPERAKQLLEDFEDLQAV